MSKTITAADLGLLINGLLNGSQEGGIEDGELFEEFMTEQAKLVCRFMGGEVLNKASIDLADNQSRWQIKIGPTECLPPDGGVWRQYDCENTFEVGS